MDSMFSQAGRNATTWSIGDLSNWNTSKVTNMQEIFSGAGYNAASFVLNLSNWNTSKVRYASEFFNDAGRNATT